MSPEDKAAELVEMFASMDSNINSYACDKQCALIVVDEVLKETLSEYTNDENHDRVEYWQEVKNEINKL